MGYHPDCGLELTAQDGFAFGLEDGSASSGRSLALLSSQEILRARCEEIAASSLGCLLEAQAKFNQPEEADRRGDPRGKPCSKNLQLVATNHDQAFRFIGSIPPFHRVSFGVNAAVPCLDFSAPHDKGAVV
jgi:hypothetical protein